MTTPLSPHGIRPRHRRRETPRCSVCGLHLSLCVCARLPHVTLPWRLIVVQHGVEVDRPTNTGRLALHLLTNSVRVLYARRGVPLDTTPLEDPAWRYWLLFPRPEAPVLTAEMLAGEDGRPASLVVVDGTWAQASHMTRRIRPLHAMPVVRLPAGPPGIWTIRRSRSSDMLCTMEAVIRAVHISGYPREAEALYAALVLIHERLWAMREGRVGRVVPQIESRQKEGAQAGCALDPLQDPADGERMGASPSAVSGTAPQQGGFAHPG